MTAALDHIAKLEGWCPPEKVAELMRLVDAYKPAVLCEIGVYGGRSLLPMALACRGTGQIYGVEPWSVAAALEGGVLPKDAEWWIERSDIYRVKRQFLEAVASLGLADTVRILEGPSHLVHPAIPEIDLLHIDGNHSPEVSLRDAEIYLAKTRPGGWVVMDDTNNDQVTNALRRLDAACHLIRDWGAWRVYRKRW